MAEPNPHHLKPLSDDDWPPALDDLKSSFLGKANVYRVMAHHPALLRAWCDLRQHVVVDSAFDRQTSEIIILRTAVATASPYEWAHHVMRARKLGMDDARIASLAGPLAAMEPGDLVLCQAVDELHENARLSPQALDALMDHVGKQGVLDLMATLGFYATLAFMLNSFDVPIEPDLRAALSADPLPAGPGAPPL